MPPEFWRCDATGIWWFQLHNEVLAEVWRDGSTWKGVVKVAGKRREIHDDSLAEMKEYAESVVRDMLTTEG